jgi:hypothetical protein
LVQTKPVRDPNNIGVEDADVAGDIYEWKPMPSGNEQYTFLIEPETVIAIKLKRPEYFERLGFIGLWKPVASKYVAGDQTVFLLYDTCEVNTDGLNFPQETLEKIKINYPKHGGASSIVITSPDNKKTVLAILPLKVNPCVNP